MKYKIKYNESVVEYIAKIGYDSTYGARPMKRAIQDKVEDFLSEEVLLGKLKENTQYVLKVEEETVKITKGK
jgi:ATP-dependent Clp protease ATP-binding subunit ClpC